MGFENQKGLKTIHTFCEIVYNPSTLDDPNRTKLEPLCGEISYFMLLVGMIISLCFGFSSILSTSVTESNVQGWRVPRTP